MDQNNTNSNNNNNTSNLNVGMNFVTGEASVPQQIVNTQAISQQPISVNTGSSVENVATIPQQVTPQSIVSQPVVESVQPSLENTSTVQQSISNVNLNSIQQVNNIHKAKEQNMDNRTEKKMEEISIKFGKGLAEPFTGKDGKEYMRILIPNQDKSDHTPWASFVLPAKSVHENKYGKGLWAKIPADGTTTVTKAVQVGEQDGKRIWENQKTAVPNRELKARVEAYKSRDRESARGKLEQLTAQVAEKLSPNTDRPRARAAGMEK